MKKALRVLIVCLLTWALCLLAGCAGKDAGTGQNAGDRADGAGPFTVTFDAAGGSAVEAQQVEWGRAVHKPQDPQRTGYTFTGWTCNGEAFSFEEGTVTENLTLTATWQADTYTLTFRTPLGSPVQSTMRVYHQSRQQTQLYHP